MNQETYVEESPVERKARLCAEDEAAKVARVAQIEAAHAPTRNVNAEFFEAEERRAKEAAANKPIVGKAPTVDELVAQVQNTYLYAPYDPTIDPTHPLYVAPKKSIVKTKPQQPQIDPLDLITHPEMAQILERPMSPQDQRNAELQMRPASVYTGPMRECPTCHARVPANKSWHEVEGERCVIDVEAAKR